MSIKFNGDFEKNLRAAMAGSVNAQLRNHASRLQHEVDGVNRSLLGRSVSEVKPMLQNACLRAGVTATDSELTAWSQVIASGRRLVIRSQDL